MQFLTCPTQVAYVQEMLSPLVGTAPPCGAAVDGRRDSFTMGERVHYGSPPERRREERNHADQEREEEEAVQKPMETSSWEGWEASMCAPFAMGTVVWNGMVQMQSVGRTPVEEEEGEGEDGAVPMGPLRSLSPMPHPPWLFRRGHGEEKGERSGQSCASSMPSSSVARSPPVHDGSAVLGYFELTWPPVRCAAYVSGGETPRTTPRPCTHASEGDEVDVSMSKSGKGNAMRATEAEKEGETDHYVYLDTIFECPLRLSSEWRKREEEAAAVSVSPSPQASGGAAVLRRRPSVLETSTMTLPHSGLASSVPSALNTSRRTGTTEPKTLTTKKTKMPSTRAPPPLFSSSPSVRMPKGSTHGVGRSSVERGPATTPSLPTLTVTARVQFRFCVNDMHPPLCVSPDGPSASPISLPCEPPCTPSHPSPFSSSSTPLSPTDITAVEEADRRMVETFFRGELQHMTQLKTVMEEEHQSLLLSSASFAEAKERRGDVTEEMSHRAAEGVGNAREEVSPVDPRIADTEAAPTEETEVNRADEKGDQGMGKEEDVEDMSQKKRRRGSNTWWGDSILLEIRETQQRIESELHDGEAFLTKCEEEEGQLTATADSRIRALQNDLKEKEEVLAEAEAAQLALLDATHQRQEQLKAAEKELMEYVAAEMHRYAMRLQEVRSKE